MQHALHARPSSLMRAHPHLRLYRDHDRAASAPYGPPRTLRPLAHPYAQPRENTPPSQAQVHPKPRTQVQMATDKTRTPILTKTRHPPPPQVLHHPLPLPRLPVQSASAPPAPGSSNPTWRLLRSSLPPGFGLSHRRSYHYHYHRPRAQQHHHQKPAQKRSISWAHALKPLRPSPSPSSPSPSALGLGAGIPGAGSSADFPEHPDNEHDVARAAILDKVMKGRQPTDLMLRCTILDAEGRVKTISGQFKKSDLCAEHGLHARDLRKIDSRVPNLVPTILVRKEAILINMLHIRALVKADTVILFDTYGSADSRLHSVFLYHLEHNLKTKNAGMPYEFRALDSILLSVLSALEAEMVFIRTLVGGLLAEMDDTIDHDRFKRLLHYSRRLAGFRNRAGLVEEAIAEVLSQDEDMDAMYLTEKKRRGRNREGDSSGLSANPSLSPGGAGQGLGVDRDAEEVDDDVDEEHHRQREEHDHEELEVLLESFSKQVEEIVNEAETIETNVQSTQEIVELILDANRNALLALDLKVSIATLGIGSGALVAGLFGMNLMSHIETHPYGFLVVTGSAGMLAFGVAWAGLRRLAKIRKVGLAGSHRSPHHPWVALPLRGRNPGGWS